MPIRQACEPHPFVHDAQCPTLVIDPAAGGKIRIHYIIPSCADEGRGINRVRDFLVWGLRSETACTHDKQEEKGKPFHAHTLLEKFHLPRYLVDKVGGINFRFCVCRRIIRRFSCRLFVGDGLFQLFGSTFGRF